MIICRICNKEFKNSKSLISHIKIHKISSKEYYDKYLKKENEGICSTCGKNTKFKKFTLGYHKFCSCSCSSISKDTITKRESTNLKIYGTINQFDRDSIKKIIKNKKIKSIESKINLYGYKLLSTYNNKTDIIKVQCNICDSVFETIYFNLYQGCGKCPNCFPKYKSNGEIELFNFIKSIESSEIIENSRKIIHRLELDIYIPLKNISIEFNGLYYHSNNFIIDKYYHLNKTEKCLKNNIQLIHIFEDEWIYKKDIVKSRLRQILQLTNSQKIHARKCIIKDISPKIKNEFLEKYHIQSCDRSNIKLGAFYDNELISVMTFSKGSIAKGSKNIEGVWELNRFCSNYNYHIPGIASKLLTHFKRNYQWKEIFSYADRRWSLGNVYYKLGFELDSITKPNYFYVKGINRIHRFNLRKKLEEPKDIPEWILRQKEGYYRIWDCGHYKFIMRK